MCHLYLIWNCIFLDLLIKIIKCYLKSPNSLLHNSFSISNTNTKEYFVPKTLFTSFQDFWCTNTIFVSLFVRKFNPHTHKFITINVILHTKSEQKVIGNWFCTLIIFKNRLKTGFSIRNIIYYNLCRIKDYWYTKKNNHLIFFSTQILNLKYIFIVFFRTKLDSKCYFSIWFF